MLISIQDVPRYERHLLFCSQLDQVCPTRRHGRRVHVVPAISRLVARLPPAGCFGPLHVAGLAVHRPRDVG